MNKKFYHRIIDSIDLILTSKSKIFSSTKVVLYHSVSKTKSFLLDNLGPTMFVDENIFERHLMYYKENYNIISLRDFFSKKSIPKNSLIITFDDGYRDNFLNVYPLLEKHSIPATICITTDFLNNNDLLWLSKIQLLKSLNIDSSKFSKIDLYQNNHKELDEFVNRVFKSNGLNLLDFTKKFQLYLNSDDIYNMNPDIISICSHSKNHYKSIDLDMVSRIIQIKNSINDLSRFKDYYLPVYSFPYGDFGNTFDSIDLEILRDNNIRHYFSSQNGGGLNYNKHNFEIKRASISDRCLKTENLKKFIETPISLRKKIKSYIN